MASPKQHRDQAERNEAFYGKVREHCAEHPDWAFTALFYAAVHETQAFLVSKRQVLSAHGKGVPQNHHDRSAALGAHWKKLGQLYDQFFDLTNQFRYDCLPVTLDDLNTGEQLLQRIKDRIASYG